MLAVDYRPDTFNVLPVSVSVAKSLNWASVEFTQMHIIKVNIKAGLLLVSGNAMCCLCYHMYCITALLA